MINLVPIFPLGIVVYPGENLHLHIFEPRYKQLINDCYTQQKPFGIPVVLNEAHIQDLGTLLTITEITKTYSDGKMDIKTKGLKVFNVLEVVKDLPDKLYSGAIVAYPNNDETTKPTHIQKLLENIYELHKLLNLSKDFKKTPQELLSYDVAHHIGLSLEQEYELLGLMREEQRIEYLKRHLQKVIPVIKGMESLREKIQLNGHFKELKGFNL